MPYRAFLYEERDFFIQSVLFKKTAFIDAFPRIFVAAQLKFETTLENKKQKISNGLNIIIFVLHMTSFIFVELYAFIILTSTLVLVRYYANFLLVSIL